MIEREREGADVRVVFGMSHEHQRWDRDDHVEFRCENLAGIYEAANRLSAERNLDEHRAMEMLCSNRDVAVEYKSPSADYGECLFATMLKVG